MEVPQIMQNVLSLYIYIFSILNPLVFGIPIFQETSRAVCATNANWVKTGPASQSHASFLWC